jgi:hypothetical protein
MASNKPSVEELLAKLIQNSLGEKFPDKIVELETLLTDNLDRLENLSAVISAKDPLEALQALTKISKDVEPLANFLQNFKDGKSVLERLQLEELEKQGLLNKQQRETAEEAAHAAEEAARISQAFYDIAKKVKSSKGKDIPFDEIDNILKDIPALNNIAKHIPVAQLDNLQQMAKSVQKFRDDYKYYKDNKDKMNPEQKKQCKDGLKMEAVGLAVAGSGIAAGIGLAAAAALVAAPIPGLNAAVLGVAAAVTIGFIIYKIGHKMNKEVKQELTEGLEVTDRKDSKTRLAEGLREKTLGSIKKILSFSMDASHKKAQAENMQPPAPKSTNKPKLN